MQAARKLRLGMVGGGEGAFIGAVHRMAARLDDRFELVAGALSSTSEKALRSGRALRLDTARIYADFNDMATAEASRPDGIDAVAIVTPNWLHYAAARAFLEAGIDVICDKPMTSTLEDARALATLADKGAARLFLTHIYTGYPMVRQAREMIAAGEIGALRLVQVEYVQDWLAEPAEDEKGVWRMDPARAGQGGAIGDIGTHAFNLAEYVSGRRVEALNADLFSFVPGRALDDNAHVMLRFGDGVRGLLWCSQVAVGNENELRLRIYGDRGGLEWTQAEANRLYHTPLNEPTRILSRNGSGSGPEASRVARIPSGHPEGYLEAFATLYCDIADAIETGRESPWLPGAADGLRGMAFIAGCVDSHAAGGVWQRL